MTVISRIEPIDDYINIIVKEDLSPVAQSRAIAAFARERFNEAATANRNALGRVPRYDVAVDGRRGAPLEAVKPSGGIIVFNFELVGDVLRWILQQLKARSPVVSGAYRDGHRLFADGREIAVTADMPEASEFTITNTVAYARKIEIGRTRAGRAFVIQVAPKIYQRTATDARRRFGNIVRIDFSFRTAMGGSIVGGRAGNRSSARAPAIIVRDMR